MDINLPLGFDPTAVATLEEAQGWLGRFMNLFEELTGKVDQLLKENQTLRKEVARLKKQSPQPQFPKKTSSPNVSITQQSKQQLQEKKLWHKSVKKGTIFCSVAV